MTTKKQEPEGKAIISLAIISQHARFAAYLAEQAPLSPDNLGKLRHELELIRGYCDLEEQ